MRSVGQKGQSTHHSSWRVETVQNLQEKKAGQPSRQTEGQINRHKTLKRALFGRANTVLLRPRFLPIGEVRSPSLRMTLIYGNATVVHPAASVTSVCARNAVPVFLVGRRNFGPSPSDCPADRPGRLAPWDLGATFIDLHRTTLMGGFLLEAIGTFFLANTVLNAVLRGTAGRLAPFAIGMTVTVCILAFGPITGGSVNPARTFGPALQPAISAKLEFTFPPS